MDSGPGKTVLVVENDLFFSSRIAGTLKSMGLIPVVTSSESRIDEMLAAGPPALAIVDMAAGPLDPLTVVAKLKSPRVPVPVIAFCEHTNGAALEEARRAGCEQVVSNGKLAASLKELVLSCLG